MENSLLILWKIFLQTPLLVKKKGKSRLLSLLLSVCYSMYGSGVHFHDKREFQYDKMTTISNCPVHLSQNFYERYLFARWCEPFFQRLCAKCHQLLKYRRMWHSYHMWNCFPYFHTSPTEASNWPKSFYWSSRRGKTISSLFCKETEEKQEWT